MPITRLYNYLPGSLAEGEKVSGEFDSIIAFINGLEVDKLDAVGGNVSDLHVLSTLEVDGLGTFDAGLDITGDVDLDGDLILTSAGDLILGDASNIQLGNPGAGVNINKGVGVEILSAGAGLRFGALAGGIDFDVGGQLQISGNGLSGYTSGFQLDNTMFKLSTDKVKFDVTGVTAEFDLDLKVKNTKIFSVGDTAGSEYMTVQDLGASLRVVMLGLPVVNPGGSGRLWNNAGVLNIT